MKARNGRMGFTLLEILIVAAILGLVAVGTTTVVMAAQRTWEGGSGEVFLTTQLRHAVGQMTRELANTPVDQIARPLADGNWDTTVIFRIPQDQNADGNVLDASGSIIEWSVWLRYLLGANNLLQRKLNTTPTVTFQTVTGNISAVQFRRQPATPDVVEIQVTAATQKGGRILTRSMGNRLKLRNLQSGVGVPEENPPDDF